MRIIKELSRDIRENITEARHHIDKAYELKASCRHAADWYKQMASAHLEFNTAGHASIRKLIDDYNAKGEHSPLEAGMMAVYEEIHADLIKEAEEVRYLIEQYAR